MPKPILNIHNREDFSSVEACRNVLHCRVLVLLSLYGTVQVFGVKTYAQLSILLWDSNNGAYLFGGRGYLGNDTWCFQSIQCILELWPSCHCNVTWSMLYRQESLIQSSNLILTVKLSEALAEDIWKL